MAWIRFIIALVLGFGLNLGLFALLSRMTTHDSETGETVVASKIEFVRLRREVEVEERKREKPQRVKPEQAPVVPTMSVAKEEGVNLELDVQAIAAGLGAEFGSAAGGGGDGSGGGVPGGISFGGGMSDRAPLPLVRVEPLYPPQAAKRGLEGWVQLRFTISTAGSVQNAAVVKSSNPVFNRAALEAVAKWKYEPQMQAGNAIATPGVEVVLRFKMES